MPRTHSTFAHNVFTNHESGLVSVEHHVHQLVLWQRLPTCLTWFHDDCFPQRGILIYLRKCCRENTYKLFPCIKFHRTLISKIVTDMEHLLDGVLLGLERVYKITSIAECSTILPTELPACPVHLFKTIHQKIKYAGISNELWQNNVNNNKKLINR